MKKNILFVAYLVIIILLSCEKEKSMDSQFNITNTDTAITKSLFKAKVSSMPSANLLVNSVDVGDFYDMCRGTISLSTGITGSFYYWQKVDGNGVTTALGSSPVISLTPSEYVVKYSVYVSNNSIVYYDELNVTVNDLPQVCVLPSNSYGYQGISLILKATINVLPSHTYQWYIDNDSQPLNDNASFTGTTTYQISTLVSQMLVGHKIYCKVVSSKGCTSYTSQTTLQIVNILSATSAQDLPPRFFKVDQIYKNNYVHLKQQTGECSWTSYVLCAGAIAKGKSFSYDVSYNKVTTVKAWCGNTYIERLKDYALQVDNTFLGNTYLSKEQKTSSGRFNTIKQMLFHIDTHKTPFVPIIVNSGIGHYVVVWSIDWKQGESESMVYYTDPLDLPVAIFDLQIKSMNMTDFLDKMGPLNNDVSSYCCLLLR